MSLLAFLMLLGIAYQTPSNRQIKRITPDELRTVILHESECLDPEMKLSPDQALSINHLEYSELTGDGREEAIVVASTCMTGTAGPDIHAVYARDFAGKVVELPVNEKTLGNRRLLLFGNTNYSFSEEGGLLTARFRDTSDRGEPAVIQYKWNGKEFVVESMKQEGPFPTSYDCSRATEETEQAICYSPSLARLDQQLKEAYRARSQKSPAEARKVLQTEQRMWLTERNKSCSIYKWWVECLSELYTRRISQLQSSTSK